MGGPKSKAVQEDIIAAFATAEPFKVAAARLGMSPNTLRRLWQAEFGEEAFTSRGKKIQAEAAAKVCRETASSRTYKEVQVSCSQCGGQATLRSNQVAQMADLATFLCEDCRCDRACPVCDLQVDGERGLAGHFRHRREAGDEAHVAYQGAQEGAVWAAGTLGADYVACILCGHRSESLARHLTAAHGITADEYRRKYGSDAAVLSQKASRAMAEAARNRAAGAYAGTKKVRCPSCGQEHEVHKLAGTVPCPACKAQVEAARWAGLSEPEDYVCCLDCGYRAENLTSHVQNAHPDYRVRHQGAPMVALHSAVRDKTALHGLVRPPEFGQKIREAKLIGLTMVSFEPFKEPDGAIDHRAMMRAVGCAWPTLKRYMDDLGLKATLKYIEQRQEVRRVHVPAETLAKFKLKNGKVSIALAVSQLSLCNITIKKECRRLGMPWAHGNVAQRKCLDAVSEALGGLVFEEEWKSWRFTNTPTGHRFRFDGYFPDVGLIVEFQGMFHYTFPNPWMIDESYRSAWDKLVERDRIKKALIEAVPDLIYFEVTEDEPFTDVMYLAGRLQAQGLGCGSVPMVGTE